jgi:hypothetical protein
MTKLTRSDVISARLGHPKRIVPSAKEHAR